MDGTMMKFLIAFVVLDLIVMVIVLKRVVKLKVSVTTNLFRGGQGPGTLDQLRALGQFARDQHERIGEYMRANWSGMPEQLPSVIAALLDELDKTAREKGLALDRGVLKAMLASSLRSHRIGRGRELREAIQKVA